MRLLEVVALRVRVRVADLLRVRLRMAGPKDHVVDAARDAARDGVPLGMRKGVLVELAAADRQAERVRDADTDSVGGGV